MKKTRIGFISEYDLKDKKVLSGTQYKLYEHMSKTGFDVIWIPVKRSIIVKIYSKLIRLISLFLRKGFSPNHTYFVAKSLSSSINKTLLDQADILFTVVGSQYLYDLKSSKPIIYVSDATFSAICNYYPEYSNLFNFNIKQGNKIEQTSLNKASHIIFASDWARNSAINDYDIPKDKTSVIEFGANIDEHDIRIKKDKSDCVRILFLAVEWKRKGGDIAVETCKLLNTMGIKSTIYIVGIKKLPSKYENEVCIKHIGFLNKNSNEEYNQLLQLFSDSDILLLPTKAECAGVAFSESSSFGLPIFTYDTGGISNYVANGINGYRLPPNSTAKDFADKIIECLNNEEMTSLRKGCKELFENKLNWHVWMKHFNSIINNLPL